MQVTSLAQEKHPAVTEHLQALADGPGRVVATMNSYMVNGCLFRTKDSEMERETQNSGIVVLGENDLEYYGLLREVIEVQYTGGNRVTLFMCDWWDVHSHGRGITKDCFEFISVNIGKVLGNDPYVLASQVGQVYYVQDVAKPNWKVVVKANPRNFYDVPEILVQDSIGETTKV